MSVRRDPARATQARQRSWLRSIGVPDALALSDALLRCTGAELVVQPRPAAELGFVIEVAIAAPHEPGLHLDAGILSAHTATGETVWSRPLATIHHGLERKLSNVLQVSVESRPHGQNTMLRITEIRVMWALSTGHLETQLLTGAAGLLAKRRRFAIAISRSQLQTLDRNVLHVTVSDATPSRTLLITTIGQNAPDRAALPKPGC